MLSNLALNVYSLCTRAGANVLAVYDGVLCVRASLTVACRGASREKRRPAQKIYLLVLSAARSGVRTEDVTWDKKKKERKGKRAKEESNKAQEKDGQK